MVVVGDRCQDMLCRLILVACFARTQMAGQVIVIYKTIQGGIYSHSAVNHR